MPKAQKKIQNGEEWFLQKGWEPFEFQTEAWNHFHLGHDGIVNAPTGSGKTYSLIIPIIEHLKLHQGIGLVAIWVAPIKALAKEIQLSAERAIEAFGIDAQVGIRTGDTSTKEKQNQIKKMPQILITTPESLHILLSRKHYPKMFSKLQTVVVDEWHDLIGGKRGVQIELALSRLKRLQSGLQIWGISATIGNMQEALHVLLGSDRIENGVLVKSKIKKKLIVDTLMPDDVSTIPWAGHLGLTMIDKVFDIINQHASTLIFTNTRAQSEIWYHQILDANPDLAGVIAMHHSSISKDLRFWVEEALHNGQLKAVVCTSSLDLGVDFRPVEAIVQVGGPKGVARFVQRAGRSGHQPGATSKIFFLPTNALELIEAASLRKAIEENYMESREPYIRSFDVLVQYLVTLAVSDGFNPDEVFEEITSTFCFESVNREEFNWCLQFITTGGESLRAYDEYKKVERVDGLYKVLKNAVARKHRMSIGTIVSDKMLLVKYHRGSKIGHVEEYFVSSLNPGDVFWFAGRALEMIKIKDLVVSVRPSKKEKGKIPSWQGGRLNFSSKMSDMLRNVIDSFKTREELPPEMLKLQPILNVQSTRSHLPGKDEFLIEQMKSKEGYHLFLFPFEGRLVHEGIASLLAYRLSLIQSISFSLAYNDYGLELLSDQPIPLEEGLDNTIFTTDYLMEDLEASINSSEMARRKFRDIAVISGMIFTGYPGKYVKDRHLQSSSSLIFDVFQDYDPSNLLLRQSFDEMIHYQLEINRFREVLKRIQSQKLIITYPAKPTPLAFPIMVDRLREKLSSESLADRIKKMTVAND